MKAFNYIFSIFCFLLVFKVQGQSGGRTLQETGLWNGVYLKGRFSEKIGYYGEHHYRLRNSESNLNDFIGRNRQIYNRFGLNIYLNPYFEIVVGPALILNFSPSPGSTRYQNVTLEPRIWHQWLFSMPSMGRVKLYHQFRFEHRWKKTNEPDAEYNYTNRYRYKFFAYISLNKPQLQVGTFFFSPSAEIFMQSGKSVISNPFEDFRTYNGFGYILNKNLTFFAGHMWTVGQMSNGFEYGTTHILRLNVFIGFDSRKVENKLPTINMGF